MTQANIDFKVRLLDEQALGGLRRISGTMESVNKATQGVRGHFSAIYSGFGKVVESFKSVTLVGAAIGGAAYGLFNFAKSAVDAIDDVGDMATRYGVAANSIQVYGDLVKDAGGSTEDAAAAFRFLNKNMSAAIGGNKEVQKAFAAVGISVDDLKHLKPEQVMERVADAFQGSNNELAKSAILTKLYGKNGTILMGIMNEGSQAIRDHYKQMGDDGRLFTEEQIENADKFAKQWQRTAGIFEGMKNTLGLELMGVLMPVIEQFREWAVANKDLIGTKFKEFLIHLPPLLESVVKVGKALGAVFLFIAGPLEWIGHTFGMTAAVVAGLTVACAPFIAAVVSLGSVVVSAIGAFVSWTGVIGGIVATLKGLGAVLAFVGVPILPLVAAIGLMGVAIYLVATRWRDMWGGLKALMEPVINWAGEKIEWLVEKFGVLSRAAKGIGNFFSPGKATVMAQAYTGTGDKSASTGGAGNVPAMLANKQQVGGQINIKIDSEGRPRVTNMQATGGIDLFANTGVMGMAM